MTNRERVEAVLQHQPIDRIPWTIYKSLTPWGEAERRFRNAGLTLCYFNFPIFRLRRPHVDVVEMTRLRQRGGNKEELVLRTFVTPKGEISYEQRFAEARDSFGLGSIIRRFDGSQVEQQTNSWITRYPFSRVSDYELIEFILDDTIYDPSYERHEATDRLVGSDGVIMANVGKSPFQSILYELMGPERCFLEAYDHPKQFEHLYTCMYKKQREAYDIAAHSPAAMVFCGDNITASITSPALFEQFCLPFYNDMAELLHSEGKVFVVHMDGELRALAELIGKTKIDVVDAVTPPPMGNLCLPEAKAMWPEKIIWCNFPEALIATSDAETIENYTVQLLRSVRPGDNFMLGCTENFPLDRWELSFEAISKALEKCGQYPIR